MGAHSSSVAGPKITVTTTGIKVTPPKAKAKGGKAKGGKAKGAKVKSGKAHGATAKAPKGSGRKPIPREIRYAVWTQYHQDHEEGICYCCGTAIRHRGWHCAHVISDAKGGSTTVDNLRPTCQHCNLSMGDQNLYAYICQKRLSGPGRRHAEAHFAQYPAQRHDKRTNNWGRKTVV